MSLRYIPEEIDDLPVQFMMRYSDLVKFAHWPELTIGLPVKFIGFLTCIPR
jgi:hypothetical protein